MPQVRSRAALQDGFSKGSIAYKAADFTGTARRVQALGEMEKKTMELKLKLITKNAQVTENRFARTERRLKDNLKRTIAYGRVTKENSISKLMGSPAYKDALNRSYTYKALRFHLVEMLSRMEPRFRREEDTKKRIDVAREQVQEVIDRNLAAIVSPRTARRQDELREKQRRDDERRRQQQRRWMPRADPVPPIEESLFAGSAEDRRELTVIKTKGIMTSKAHFKKPESPAEKGRSSSKAKGLDAIIKGVEDMSLANKQVLGPDKQVLPPITTDDSI